MPLVPFILTEAACNIICVNKYNFASIIFINIPVKNIF